MWSDIVKSSWCCTWCAPRSSADHPEPPPCFPWASKECYHKYNCRIMLIFHCQLLFYCFRGITISMILVYCFIASLLRNIFLWILIIFLIIEFGYPFSVLPYNYQSVNVLKTWTGNLILENLPTQNGFLECFWTMAYSAATLVIVVKETLQACWPRSFFCSVSFSSQR